LIPARIRVIALALCFDAKGRVLVERGYDGVRDEHFLRGIGGGVEPGERAEEALRREWREELGLTLDAPLLLGVLENFFTHEGRAGHEIVFVFRARIVDAWAYEHDEFTVTEPEGGPGVPGTRHDALWVDPQSARCRSLRVLPEGLLGMATVAGARCT